MWWEIALLVSLIVRKSLGIIPIREADPNFFLIALKQDYIDAQYVNIPYSMWPFSIFYVLLGISLKTNLFKMASKAKKLSVIKIRNIDASGKALRE